MWKKPSAGTDALFSSDLISPAVTSALPEKYTMRPLQRTDYNAGMLDVLKVLTTVGDISEQAWTERYDWMAKRGDEYYILVVCDGEGKVVGTGTVLAERKLGVALRHVWQDSFSIGNDKAKERKTEEQYHGLG